MKVQQKNNFLIIMALFAILSFCPVNAENLPSYDLHLNIEQENESKTVVEPTIERERLYSLTLDIDNESTVNSEENLEFDSNLYLPKDSSLTGFNPVITIDNSYSYNNEVSQDGFQKSNSFTLSDESGKWQFSGNYERKYFNQIENDKNISAGGLRASSIESQSSDGISNPSETSDFKTSLASSYQLEVVYSFKPTVKGKVAFTQETIDDYDTGKTIQAEAIVETRSNVQIKAGVKNQLDNNSVNNDTNLSKENKVWTEFIIKF